MMLHVETERHRLARPLVTAFGEVREREVLRVTLAWSDTDFGIGEAAPLEPYDGVSPGAVRAALDAYAMVLRDGGTHEQMLERCAAERDLPQALAAVDLALWDLRGRRAGKPVAALLAAAPLASVPVNATIGAADRAGAADEAATAAAQGFRCVKVKVGIGDDAGRVAAVRAAAGEGVAIRVDANGAWATVDEAAANLRALAPAGIELAEEPVHGEEALHALRGVSPVPIACDETFAPGVDAVCLKISRSGGITALLRDAERARSAGSAVYVASTLDGPHGIAAGLHAAAALGEPLLPCGLATFGDPFVVRDGRIAVPAGPGLLGGAPLVP